MNIGDPLRDWGRWHHEIDRFVNGEMPYKDFTWQYPPLSLFLLGFIAKIFGSNYYTMHLSTVTITGFVTILTWLIIKETIQINDIKPYSILIPISIGSILAGYASSSYGVHSFSSGYYVPAIPLGIMFSLLLLYGVIRVLRTPSNTWFFISGLASSGCFLTKQDFWVYSLSMGVLLTVIYVYKIGISSRPIDKTSLAIYWLFSLGLTLVVYFVIGNVVGMSNLLLGLQGFTDIRQISRMLPSIRSLLDQVALFSGYIFFFFLVLRYVRGSLGSRFMKKVRLIGYLSFIIGILSLGVVSVQTYFRDPISSEFQHFFTEDPVIHAVLKSIETNARINFLPGVSLSFFALYYLIKIAKRKSGCVLDASVFSVFVLSTSIITLQLRRAFQRTAISIYFIAPIFLILIAHQIISIQIINRKKTILILSLGWLISSSLFFGYMILKPKLTDPVYQITTEKGNIGVIGQDRNIQSIINMIMNKTNEHDFLLALPYESGLNYMTNRINPIEVTQFYYLNLPKEYIEKIIFDIVENKPLIVINERNSQVPDLLMPSLSIMLSWDTSYMTSPPIAWRNTYPTLWKFIEKNYRYVYQTSEWSILEPN